VKGNRQLTSLYKAGCREDHHQQFNKNLKSLHCSSIKLLGDNSANNIIIGDDQVGLQFPL